MYPLSDVKNTDGYGRIIIGLQYRIQEGYRKVEKHDPDTLILSQGKKKNPHMFFFTFPQPV